VAFPPIFSKRRRRLSVCSAALLCAMATAEPDGLDEQVRSQFTATTIDDRLDELEKLAERFEQEASLERSLSDRFAGKEEDALARWCRGEISRIQAGGLVTDLIQSPPVKSAAKTG
jgi:hypothetical protein